MAKNKVIKVQRLYDQLDEMSGFICSLLKDQEFDHTEIKYLSGFISYKNLEEEYQYFRENAHEEYDKDLPFPTLTL